MPPTDDVLERRALEVEQNGHHLYLFTLAAHEILELADVSRVGRSDTGDLIGYQREEVRKHIDEIVEYLESSEPLFPNAVILALASGVQFRKSRGPNVSDGLSSAGTLLIPIPAEGEDKPAWIVDGQQRAFALSKVSKSDLPVPVAAFVADSVDMQRDQFFRVNNTKPLPRGLVAELLPEVSTPLPPRLAAKKLPSAIVDLLNQRDDSPFQGLIRRPSTPKDARKQAVVTDTSLLKAIEENLNSTAGCLFPYRNIATGETDTDAVWSVLTVYWTAVKQTFPEAWGLPSTKSRLSHGVGIRAMGRLMDRVMYSLDASQDNAIERVRDELALVAPHCAWTSGTWEESGLKWNEVQNVPKHISWLSNFLIRTYVTGKTGHS